jgi:hypothetical protein
VQGAQIRKSPGVRWQGTQYTTEKYAALQYAFGVITGYKLSSATPAAQVTVDGNAM